MNILRLLPGNKARPHRAAHRRRCLLTLELLEGRALPSATVAAAGLYSVDGSVNNPANLGSAGTDLLRKSPVAYADGIGSPSLAGNASARVISDILNSQADPNNPGADLNTLNGNSLSDYGYSWGQFIDHDMDLTPGNASDPLTIKADPNDQSQMGDQTFNRSVFTDGTPTTGPRQQTNAVTSFLDLSQVYGSSKAIADALRTFKNGLLKTSPGGMLPYDNGDYFTADQLAIINMANDSGMVAKENLFVTGDVRGNENVELTVLQTLFVRNHNRIAGILKAEHSGWTDEQLYQEARKLNIAEYQMITYQYYLPDLLGPSALKPYAGYQANVDPSISTEFSTIGFRFGHSLLSPEIERQGNNGLDLLPNDPAGASLSLATDFFDPNVLNPNGVTDPFTGHVSTNIGPILKSQADGIAQADDVMAINDVRNLLFGNGGQTDNGLDLIARDVERARDHGIGSYNQVRVAYGLAPVSSFDDITKNVTVRQQLAAAYGTVDNIDPFEGGLAEDHVPGSDMGPLFTNILADQFTRLRDGDRNFFLNQSFNRDELNIIRQTNTLAEVIQANTSIFNLQNDVFVFRASINGNVVRNTGGRFSSIVGVPGITVQLTDGEGDVFTTVTDSRGHYSFNQQTGISATGNYTVALVLPAGYTQVSASPAPILISRGDMNVSVNFLVKGDTGSTQSAVTHFAVVPLRPAVAGMPTPVAVVALDANNQVVKDYANTVDISSSDEQATLSGTDLPTTYTFTSGDAGKHVFWVTFGSSGDQTLTVTDDADNTISGSVSLKVCMGV